MTINSVLPLTTSVRRKSKLTTDGLASLIFRFSIRRFPPFGVANADVTSLASGGRPGDRARTCCACATPHKHNALTSRNGLKERLNRHLENFMECADVCICDSARGVTNVCNLAALRCYAQALSVVFRQQRPVWGWLNGQMSACPIRYGAPKCDVSIELGTAVWLPACTGPR